MKKIVILLILALSTSCYKQKGSSGESISPDQSACIKLFSEKQALNDLSLTLFRAGPLAETKEEDKHSILKSYVENVCGCAASKMSSNVTIKGYLTMPEGLASLADCQEAEVERLSLRQ